MRYLSVASGIEAATVAWHPLGWEAAAFSEIEPFPCAVLADRWPETPNLGDMTNYKEWSIDTIDLLVGGTPCQSFSVAGLRGGLDDPRGNLMLVYLAIAQRFRPAWIVWENVPGVLSVDGGRAFGSFLGGLAELGYGWAYRVLDAQYFGVPQRRRRVFVVGYLGDWRVAAAVLFERESVRGNPPPSRETGEGVAYELAPSLTSSGRGVERAGDTRGQDPVVEVHDGRGRGGGDLVPTLCSDHAGRPSDFSPLVSTMRANGDAHSGFKDEDGLIVARSLTARNDGSPCADRGPDVVPDYYPTLPANEGGTLTQIPPIVANGVRRLTPKEFERLQGFPDDYTAITYRGKPAADGPRYRALGNSMAVPVMAWLGRRVKRVMRILCEA